MQLREAIQRNAGILRRRFWFLVISVSICTGAVFAISLYLPPVYQASALVMVNGTGVAGDDIYSDQALALNYALLVTRDDVLQAVASRIPGVSVEQLRQEVSDSPLSGTRIIEIRVQDGNPYRAATIANEVARTFIQIQVNKETTRLQNQQDQLSQQLLLAKNTLDSSQARLENLQKAHASTEAINQQRDLLNADQSNYNALLDNYHQLVQRKIQASTSLSVTLQATPPAQPVSPRVAMNTLVALLSSSLLLVFLVLVQDWLDGTIYDSEDVARRASLEPLGELPFAPSVGKCLPMVDLEHEALIHIGMNIGSLDGDRRVLFVTGVRQGSGVSTVSTNLARFLALSGLRVLLIDANWQRPSLHEVFERANTNGLANCLADIQASRKQPQSPAYSWLDQWQTPVPNLWLLPAGSVADNIDLKMHIPELKLFTEWLLGDKLNAATCAVDVIIFDGPPFGTDADVLALASIADASLLVIEAGKEQKETLGRVQSTLQRLSAPVAGVIINRRRARMRKAAAKRHAAAKKSRVQVQKVAEAQSQPALPTRLPETPPHLELIIASELLRQSSLIEPASSGLPIAMLPTIGDPGEQPASHIANDGAMGEPWQLSPHLRGISLPGLSADSNSGVLKLRSYLSRHTSEQEPE
ncbi:MAG: AAA family ATPase [Ktedonobacteraceae bacterium]|nr:AAA family ATPase [Ktedonobacteraceae bacterium]